MVMASSLRALAKSYAGGQIEKAQYRGERTRFIEAVLSGAISIRNQPAGQQAALSAESRVRNASDKTTLMGSGTPAQNAISNDEPVAENGSSKKPALIIGIAVAVIVLIAAVVFMLPGDEPAQPAAPVAGQPSAGNNTAQAIAPAPAAAATGLVRSFLDTNNWSQASIDNFLADWNRLTGPEKTALAGSIELGQLTNAIYKKLLEERALSGIGNPETSYEKQRILVDFASQTGINDSRITLPEPSPPPVQ